MELDLRLKSPSCIIISGGSSCGKTFLIEQMLSNQEDCFEKPIEELHWVYAKHAKDDELFKRLSNFRIPIQFHEGYPDQQLTDNTLFST